MRGLPPRVVHLTSAHPARDVRIFGKEARSLREAGFEVSIISPQAGDETVEGIRLVGVEKSLAGRIGRITQTAWRVYSRARAERADLYHLHEPDLLPAGLLLARRGARVVYDAHEDFPKALMAGDRDYLPRPLRALLARIIDVFELRLASRLDAVVAATPAIRRRFERGGIPATEVCNYPHPDELQTKAPGVWSRRPRRACYVGTISWPRGLREMVLAMGRLPAALGARLSLAGPFENEEQRRAASRIDGWSSVDALGPVSRDRLPGLLASARAGLVLFHPEPNHVEARPNKLFEYMSAGLPVVASDFPVWREVVERESCGHLVDPLDPAQAARAIENLLIDDEAAREMGARGLEAVRREYNWGSQEEKLLQLYRSLLA